jgi:hypothetical protein
MLICGELVVVAGGTCIVGCRRGSGCSPAARSGIAKAKSHTIDIVKDNLFI